MYEDLARQHEESVCGIKKEEEEEEKREKSSLCEMLKRRDISKDPKFTVSACWKLEKDPINTGRLKAAVALLYITSFSSSLIEGLI